MQKDYENLFSDLRRTRGASYYYIIFLGNRFLTIAYLICLVNYPIIIAQFLLVQIIFKLSYHYNARPFKLLQNNRTEIVNDVFLTMFIYYILAIMQGLYPDDTKDYIGGLIIFNITAQITYHLAVMVYHLARGSCLERKKRIALKIRNSQELEIFKHRKLVVSVYPRQFLAYEQYIFEEENIDKVKEWHKEKLWMKLNGLPYKDFIEEEKQSQNLIALMSMADIKGAQLEQELLAQKYNLKILEQRKKRLNEQSELTSFMEHQISNDKNSFRRFKVQTLLKRDFQKLTKSKGFYKSSKISMRILNIENKYLSNIADIIKEAVNSEDEIDEEVESRQIQQIDFQIDKQNFIIGNKNQKLASICTTGFKINSEQTHIFAVLISLIFAPDVLQYYTDEQRGQENQESIIKSLFIFTIKSLAENMIEDSINCIAELNEHMKEQQRVELPFEFLDFIISSVDSNSRIAVEANKIYSQAYVNQIFDQFQLSDQFKLEYDQILECQECFKTQIRKYSNIILHEEVVLEKQSVKSQLLDRLRNFEQQFFCCDCSKQDAIFQSKMQILKCPDMLIFNFTRSKTNNLIQIDRQFALNMKLADQFGNQKVDYELKSMILYVPEKNYFFTAVLRQFLDSDKPEWCIYQDGSFRQYNDKARKKKMFKVAKKHAVMAFYQKKGSS